MKKIHIKNARGEYKKYDCDYNLKENKMEIIIYNILINEFIDGFPSVITNNDISNMRLEMILIDYDINKTFLLKKVKEVGSYSNQYGVNYEKFLTREIFETNINNTNLVFSIADNKNFKIDAIEISGNPILKSISAKAYSITSDLKTIMINNISKEHVLNLGKINKLIMGVYKSSSSYSIEKVNINFFGFLKILFNESVNFDDILGKYIIELLVYLKLYGIDNLKLCSFEYIINGKKIKRYIDDYYLNSSNVINLRNKYELDVDEFLKKCYERFHMNNNYYYENYIKDLFDICSHSYLNIEDRFLMYYRFIEYYYKKTEKKYGISHCKFMKEALRKYIALPKHNANYESVGIVSLRNHYVHTGYHIHNNVIASVYNKNKPIKADVDFVLKKTKILEEVVYNIVFYNILNCKKD